MKFLVSVAFIASLIILYACNDEKRCRPNVIVIVADNLAIGDVGFFGNQMVYSSVLDSLAKSGVVFKRCYAPASSISIKSDILTGDLTHANALDTLRTESNRIKDYFTFTQKFKEEKYKVALFTDIIKSEFSGIGASNNAFDSFIGYEAGTIYSKSILNKYELNKQDFLPNVLTDSALSFIEKTKEPFMVFMSFNTPDKLDEIPKSITNSKTKHQLNKQFKSIYAIVENIDFNVSRIVNALKTYNKLKNTIIVFTSDGGPSFIRYNAKLKGRKYDLDEGGVRVPFFINYANGNFKPNLVSDYFITHSDILPTLLDLCEIKYNLNEFDGVSFAQGLVKNIDSLKDRFYFDIRSKDHFTEVAIRNEQLLLILSKNHIALYNLEIDPSQLVNIAANYPEIVNMFLTNYKLYIEKNNWIVSKKASNISELCVIENQYKE